MTMTDCQNEDPRRMVPRFGERLPRVPFPCPDPGQDPLDEFAAEIRPHVERALSHIAKENPKQRYGDFKPNLALVPPAAMIYTALAMEEGARKYGPYNWRADPVRLTTYIAAVYRHLAAWFDGEDIDPTSGKPHLGHTLACLSIMADAYEGGFFIDDRPRHGNAAAMIRSIDTARREEFQQRQRDEETELPAAAVA